jgi:hypothetical protein
MRHVRERIGWQMIPPPMSSTIPAQEKRARALRAQKWDMIWVRGMEKIHRFSVGDLACKILAPTM